MTWSIVVNYRVAICIASIQQKLGYNIFRPAFSRSNIQYVCVCVSLTFKTVLCYTAERFYGIDVNNSNMYIVLNITLSRSCPIFSLIINIFSHFLSLPLSLSFSIDSVINLFFDTHIHSFHAKSTIQIISFRWWKFPENYQTFHASHTINVCTYKNIMAKMSHRKVLTTRIFLKQKQNTKNRSNIDEMLWTNKIKTNLFSMRRTIYI